MITVFLLLGMIFIPVGFVTLRASRSVVEIVERYDADCVPTTFKENKISYITDSSIPKNCSKKLQVYKYMKAPIYVHYQLDNYYQNNRSLWLHFLNWGSVCHLQLSEQEDLIVWMRTAALPSFRKLYGRIDEDFEVGDSITLSLMNNYNTYSFGGKKKLVLSTAS
ncbi:Putative ALA-interacting subunit 2 [Linum perenne]